MNIVNNFIFIIYFVNICYAWDTDQLEVFDIVEEIKVNFYEALNVSQVSLHMKKREISA